MPCFGFFGINFFVVDCVFFSCHYFVDGVWRLKNNECKSSGSACVGVSLHIDTLDLTICTEVVT